MPPRPPAVYLKIRYPYEGTRKQRLSMFLQDDSTLLEIFGANTVYIFQKMSKIYDSRKTNSKNSMVPNHYC